MAADELDAEIGYLKKTEAWKLESRFFPSKVGGKPAWLDLKDIAVDISCGVCAKPCVFLCQFYAPIRNQTAAFHRTIFIFICKDPECCKVNQNKNFKVFRCQLPQTNAFYSRDEREDRDPNWCPDSKVENFASTCFVCGCYGSHQCSKCKTLKYCSREHQVMHWTAGHRITCGTNCKEPTELNILFPEYEVLTDQEDYSSSSDDDDDDDDYEIEEFRIINIVEDSKRRECERFLKNLRKRRAKMLRNRSPEIIKELALRARDKYFKKYQKRLSLNPDQVVRYHRGQEPIWVAEPNLSESDIPKCDYCQGPRQFEFQILSTMLWYLDVDSVEKSIDWGTLLIYTCKNNCEVGPAYKEEFLWKQDVAE